MTEFTKVKEAGKGGPDRLVAAVILAFVVMLFINGFIGSMGGVPAFVAFSMIFYWVRTRAVEEEFPAEPDKIKRILTGLMSRFAFGYLLLWGLFRILMTVSRATGWGNINGVTAVIFVKEMLAVPFWEKGAYFLAGILMFLFVLSLFPLTVIRKKGQWALYALADGGIFTVLCVGIGVLCEKTSGDNRMSRPTCLVEFFLKCGDASSRWEIAAFVTAAVLLAAVLGFTFLFSLFCLQRRQKEEEKKPDVSRKKKYVVASVAAGLGLAAAGIVTAALLFMPADEETGYERVAEFLTGDTRLGPIEYGGRVYVPVNQAPQVDENWVPRGYLAERGQDCSTRFYRMTAASLLYTDKKGKTDRIQVNGDTDAVYVPAESVKLEAEDNEVCVLWDEDWEKESAYSHEPTGYTVCGRDLLEGLRMQFPEATFRVQDFTAYDAVFTIRSYDSAEKLRTDETVMGQWEGCILVKDGKFYFGSYENPISGICLEQLKNVIGGNKT